ncbi:syntaxin-binding protein 4-like isoform X2 [Hydractinia symbiolongicarpus]|uniref:syntaxin-binding protein 4-like isoform X2 n=1 Tax=Hydractinia symbiolongicarpus TaxID=13093 RepID=UPI00255087EE|nr:syntaxin-binding protein 4-like isoform X2 [Hydractinia symbiolongicarpus]
MDNHRRVTVYLSECKGGIGMKVCGGYDERGNHIGIFVKQILENGLAKKSGKISTGDKILHVNGYSLDTASQLEAVSYLRMAAQSGTVLLVLDKTDAAHQDYEVYKQAYLSPESNNKLTTSSKRKGSVESVESSNSEDLLPDTQRILNAYTPSVDSGLPSLSPPFFSPGVSANSSSHLSTAVIKHQTSLGITLSGGINKPDGPNIYISDIADASDAEKDGRLNVGDMLVSIEGESLTDVTLEQAKSILSHLKLRKGISTYTITYLCNSKDCRTHNQPDFNNNSYTKNLPKIPESTSTHSPLSLKHLSKKLPETPSSPENEDDPLLKELLHAMEDIEDSEAGSEMYRDLVSRNPSLSIPVVSPSKMKIEKTFTPNMTISHYINPEFNSTATKKRKSNFFLHPSTPVKLEKLEVALGHLGLKPTLVEKNKLRLNLNINKNNEVLYGDFVEAVKDVFNLTDLGDYSKTLQLETKEFIPKSPKEIAAIISTDSMSYRDDSFRLRRERDEALKDVQYFRSSLIDKDRTCIELEDELLRSKQEVSSLRNECQAIRRQAQLALQTRGTDKDYEEHIRKLETEISILQSNQGSPEVEFEEIQKRLVVLGCQLRKSEVSKRTYEVAVDKLTKFVQNMYVKLDAMGSKPDEGRKSRKYNELANEARETVKSVKMLLEEEPLPFGWEEVYGSNGSRYYMNHVTQTTSWIHPVSGVQHSPSKSKK